jgi:hypothetical protein
MTPKMRNEYMNCRPIVVIPESRLSRSYVQPGSILPRPECLLRAACLGPDLSNGSKMQENAGKQQIPRWSSRRKKFPPGARSGARFDHRQRHLAGAIVLASSSPRRNRYPKDVILLQLYSRSACIRPSSSSICTDRLHRVLQPSCATPRLARGIVLSPQVPSCQGVPDNCRLKQHAMQNAKAIHNTAPSATENKNRRQTTPNGVTKTRM